MSFLHSPLSLLLTLLLLSSCGDDDRHTADGGPGDHLLLDADVEAADPAGLDIHDPSVAIRFSVVGDTQYLESQVHYLRDDIALHNAMSDSEFMLHVGDINGFLNCDEALYERVAEDLSALEIPTFIVIGDNEWNDCLRTGEAFDLWFKHFANFEERWPDAPKAAHQESRAENFAWVDRGVLFVGITLPGGRVHSRAIWQEFLDQGASWVETQLEEHADAQAMVLIAHAHPTESHDPFMDRFRAAAAKFNKPILFLHGDGHVWLHERPWAERNILRVQIEGGELTPTAPIQVGIVPGSEMPFIFDREHITRPQAGDGGT